MALSQSTLSLAASSATISVYWNVISEDDTTAGGNIPLVTNPIPYFYLLPNKNLITPTPFFIILKLTITRTPLPYLSLFINDHTYIPKKNTQRKTETPKSPPKSPSSTKTTQTQV